MDIRTWSLTAVTRPFLLQSRLEGTDISSTLVKFDMALSRSSGTRVPMRELDASSVVCEEVQIKVEDDDHHNSKH